MVCALPEMIIADDAGICAGGMRCGFSCSGFRASPGEVLMFSLESKIVVEEMLWFDSVLFFGDHFVMA